MLDHKKQGGYQELVVLPPVKAKKHTCRVVPILLITADKPLLRLFISVHVMFSYDTSSPLFSSWKALLTRSPE